PETGPSAKAFGSSHGSPFCDSDSEAIQCARPRRGRHGRSRKTEARRSGGALHSENGSATRVPRIAGRSETCSSERPRRCPLAQRKSGGRQYGKKASDKVEKAMHERKHGTLRSGGSGKKVKSRKQAIAIGLSEARREGGKVPSRGSRSRSRSSSGGASRSGSRSSSRSSSRKSSSGRS